MNTEALQRDLWIDTLRGVAILMVLVLHAVVMTPALEPHQPVLDMVNRLTAGVQLFFLLSGYVITAALERSLARGEGMRGYLLRRAAKIVPLYLLFMHLNIVIFIAMNYFDKNAIFYRNSVSDDNLNLANYLAHLVFLQGVSPKYINSLLDGSWSVVSEVYFYVTMPFIFFRLTKTPTSALICFVLSLCVSAVFSLTIGRSVGWYGYYSFITQLPCFLLGIYCYRIHQQHSSPAFSASHKAMILVALSAVFMGTAKGQSAPIQIHVLVTILFALALILAPVHSDSRIARVIRSFGRQSYALFLVHMVILRVFYTVWISKHDPGLFWGLVINLTLAIPFAWLLSWVIFDRIDRWFVGKAAAWLRRRRGSAAEPVASDLGTSLSAAPILN